MCWAHMIRKCREHRAMVPREKWSIVERDILTIQLSFGDHVFDKVTTLLLAKWRTDSDFAAFSDYFEKQWLNDLKFWYEGTALGVPSTNNGLESSWLYAGRLITIPMMCSFKTDLKTYICKHAVGIMMHFGFYVVSDSEKLDDLGKRRRRPKKATSALCR
ncbi:unnamed protein product [Didymodactylos carnosus]|uniref:Uncharacterized protein n=1 Tax=Didymodactylos carnosus TaxID=1234261 RepID=A0A815HZQ6_9BILA|nr:unnamed protein product [Didymodactylos carnosus]CAF1360679.1 unnamed protein product [Didymodactylos carnosus]CAF3849208.1 unnamed protein product [Didymodactylos carnosus]CAF4238735.1 unnamed protein product [Didymodactylos carnosus]